MVSPNAEVLVHRLQGIASASDHHQEKLILLAVPEVDLPSGKSDQPFACPYEGCGRHFSSEQLCREHNRSTHRFSCRNPGCERDFTNGALLAQHEDEHTRRDSNFQTRTCPHPGCGQIFPDQATLFAHYDGLRPLSVYSPGRKLPYKCPFCQKKYVMERYMTGHQRREHSTNGRSPSEQYESQAALIRESHASMARKASRVPAENTPIIYSAAKTSTKPQVKREEGTLTMEKPTVYMDEIEPVSPPYHQSSGQVSYNRSEKMAVGYVLHSDITADAPPYSENEDMDSGEEHPETYALDDWEMPWETAIGLHQKSDRFPSDALGYGIIHWVLTLLDMNHWLTVSEVVELWDAFLTPAQRVIILEQLNQIDVGRDDTAVLSALHGSVLCESIHGWAQFKLLTLQVPEELRQHSSSAKGTTWAILKYCTELERLIKEGRLTASALDLVWPVSLREAPVDEARVHVDAPFIELLAALEARVKCRTVHPSWTQFTNELVLKEMTRYLQDLKTEAEATRSLNLRTIDWFGKMNLL